MFGHVVLTKFLKALCGIFSFMSELTPEQRKELLFELDKIVRELNSVVGRIRNTTDRLQGVVKNLRDYVAEIAERFSPLADYSHLEGKTEWNPDDFDLMQLKNDFLEFKRLAKAKRELEQRLGVSLR